DRVGDVHGSTLDQATGRVTTPPGFKQAYDQYVAAGWNAVAAPEEFGGGGFPVVVGMAMQELFATANMAFSLCPMLTLGGIELLHAWGTPAQRERYLPKLVSGQWTATMNLTEPDAGSDVGAVRTVATPVGESGLWTIEGTKIFITWGDHDLADNVVHLVLARVPGAPAGTRGISLFAVPAELACLTGEDERNRVTCVSLEKKLGIHASPTCVLAFDGAVGELVGEVNGGMKAMFTMMNRARLSVGVEGLAISERAFQLALAYASERRQGRAAGSDSPGPVAIVEHPDVRRTLVSMRAHVDAMRLLIYTTAVAIETDEPMAALLVPLAKAWPTDVVNEVTSQAVQVFGGMGFVEEAGVAQRYRDARITSIYEGTNGIQAIDLVLRKLDLGEGSPLAALLERFEAAACKLRHEGGGRPAAAGALQDACQAVRSAAKVLIERREDNVRDALAGASTFLRLLASTVAGGLLAELLAAGDLESDRATPALFFLTNVLPPLRALPELIALGSDGLYAISAQQLASE
ncbi:MAG: 3-(methylsulfanyl)propanoyl-CoA dehydrogenase, partial [Actinomycetota bacterium]|nr:3-(methylsulfanyl)propanoyl-CoA dehydrogenase [Actinomycetota bacterium]